MKAWAQLYKSKQWHRYATFEKKSSLNIPYLLFKAKNVVDHSVRGAKWMKARPIAPQTKHPMRRLFHLTGRAWSFITSNLASDNFVIKHGGQVTQFLREVQDKLGPKGEIRCVIKDIEGCFPAMPKDVIRIALRSELHKLEAKYGYDGISVPKQSTKSCSFADKGGRNWVRIPFEDLAEIAEWALDNTLVRGLDGQILRQDLGIPMGDPHSPGFCIGTCAWMEHEWLQTVDAQSRSRFMARRYMDDVLAFYAHGADWDEARFLEHLNTECYLPPLELGDGGDGTFLETSFRIEDNAIRHWLKNVNSPGQPPTVWRYAHFDSHADFTQKRATLMACLRKVHNMASDAAMLRDSAARKLFEFAALGYPRKLLWTACTTLGVATRDPTWFRVREARPCA